MTKGHLRKNVTTKRSENRAAIWSLQPSLKKDQENELQWYFEQ